MRYTALPTNTVRAFQSGAPDAHAMPPERAISDGKGTPCRHCLRDVPEDQDMLILAYRPFDGLHPYAELGPIFLCAEPCTQGGGMDTPDILTTSPDYLVKGYSRDDRIVYGTGAVIPAEQVATRAETLLADPAIAYVHVRSARNNCYLLRIDR
ncbi:DUF1203 domain-containing protein [Marimonas sp. MJW-29]|uniref:DUF1203 domain-containing protein n=1 Tax=Sulfitobacter sediminis TaxID=3234186 RepID=A0ABV3RGR9_9RHOB